MQWQFIASYTQNEENFYQLSVKRQSQIKQIQFTYKIHSLTQILKFTVQDDASRLWINSLVI